MITDVYEDYSKVHLVVRHLVMATDINTDTNRINNNKQKEHLLGLSQEKAIEPL